MTEQGCMFHGKEGIIVSLKSNLCFLLIEKEDSIALDLECRITILLNENIVSKFYILKAKNSI